MVKNQEILEQCILHAKPYSVGQVPPGSLFFHTSYGCVWLRTDRPNVDNEWFTVVTVFKDDTSGIYAGMRLAMDGFSPGTAFVLDADFFAGDKFVHRTYQYQPE